MKHLVHLLIGHNQSLLQHHRAIVQHHHDTLAALTKLLDSCPEHAAADLTDMEVPRCLPPGEESALLKRILAAPAGSDGVHRQHSDPGLVLPRHVSVTFIAGYLDISLSTFYRQVNGRLLTPAFRIGNRPYFLLDDLLALERHRHFVPHEKGAWTFAKINKKQGSPRT